MLLIEIFDLAEQYAAKTWGLFPSLEKPLETLQEPPSGVILLLKVCHTSGRF